MEKHTKNMEILRNVMSYPSDFRPGPKTSGRLRVLYVAEDVVVLMRVRLWKALGHVLSWRYLIDLIDV